MRKFGNWWLAIIILLACAILIWDMAQPRINPSEINKQLEEALQKHDIPQAIQILENAIRKEPKYYPGRIQLVQIYLSQVPLLPYEQRELHILKAQQHLNFYIKNDPKYDPRMLMYQVQIFEAQRRFADAYQTYREILEKVPTMVEARIGILPLCLAKQNISEIQEQITFLRQQPNEFFQKFPHFYDLQAEFELLQGNLEATSESWSTFLQRVPQLFRTQRDWIEIQQALGKLSQVREKYYNTFSNAQNEIERFYFQQLYAQTLPLEQAISFLEGLRKNYENTPSGQTFLPQLYMQSISFGLRNGDIEKAISDCNFLATFPDQDSTRRMGWLAYCHLLKKEWEICEKINQELYHKPESKSMGINGLLNLELSRKNYPIAKQYIAEILRPYQSNQLWNLDLHKEFCHYRILQTRVLYESESFEEAISIAQTLQNSPKGWTHHWLAKFLLGQIYLAQNKYDSAGIVLEEIIQNGLRVPELRLKSILWKGIAEFLAGKDPQSSWEMGQHIAWKDFLTDARESSYYSILLGKETPSNLMSSIEKIPNIGNDHYFYLGICYEKQAQWENARQAYQKGIDVSNGQEFPYFLLVQAYHRVKNK